VLRADVLLDVAGQGGLERGSVIAARVCTPSDAAARRPIVVMALPGSSYSRLYYDMEVPGHSGYSMGEVLAQAGVTLISLDYPGLGGSTTEPGFRGLGKDDVLAACQAATDAALERLRSGALIPRMEPLEPEAVVGMGHSLGGYFLTRQQGAFATFDAVAVLGWTQFLPPWTAQRSDAYHRELAVDPDRTHPGRLREREREYFYGPDVPADVIDADAALAVGVYPFLFGEEKWGLQDDPASPGAAAVIDVPVFLCFAELDMAADPYREPQAYRRSSDITLFHLPRAGHCATFAPTRRLLFDRLASWIDAVASRAR
jgi:hypothetical protein